MPSADELNARGIMYHNSGQYEPARIHYDAALLIDPDHFHALQNLTGVLLTGRLTAAALSVGRRAIIARPDNIGAHVNYCAALFESGRYDEALFKCREILDMGATQQGVWHNMGLILNMKGQYVEAETAYTKSLELQPDNTMVLSDRAMAIMSQGEGNFARGVKEYEVRWRPDDKHQMVLYRAPIFDSGVPQWKGEDLMGKRLLVCHEQGFGDSIMFVRFVKELQAQGVDLAIAVPDELHKLFQQFGTPVCHWQDATLGPQNCDYFITLMSLLGVMNIEPSKIRPDPYLTVPVTDDSLGPEGYRIGVCWSSGDHNFALAHRRRYISLDVFFPLSEIPGVRLVSLQKGQPEKDILNLGAESFIFNPMPRCTNFYDTARIIQGLDLVITVDSSVAHLAGALGKPCIMLEPFVRCWRWWNEGSGRPWYKNFKIIKQYRFGDWTNAVAEAIDTVKYRVGKSLAKKAV